MQKSVFRIVFPTVLSFTLSSMYSIIDGIFVGKAAQDAGLAAINIAWPVPAVILAVGVAIGSGGSILVSDAIGRKNEEEAEQMQSQTICMLIVAGMVCTIFFYFLSPGLLRKLGARHLVYTYALAYARTISLGALCQVLATGLLSLLRNLDRAVEAMILLILGVFLNMGANALFMFHFHLQTQGAALGTIVSQAMVCVGCLSLYRWKLKGQIHWSFELGRMCRIWKQGIASFGLSLAPSIALVFTNWQCLRLGGQSAVASYAAISYIVFPLQNVFSGIGEGFQPLISYYHGAEEEKRLQNVLKAGFGTVVLISLVATILVLLSFKRMGEWFSLSAKGSVYFYEGIRIYAMGFCLMGLERFGIARMNASLRAKTASILIYVESLVINPLGLFVFPLFWGLKGLWIASIFTSICLCLIYIGIQRPIWKRGMYFEK